MNTTVNTDQSDKKIKEFEENQSMMKEMIDNLQSQLENNSYTDLDKKKIDFCIKIINYLIIHIRSHSIIPQETRYQKLCRYTRHFKYLEKWHQKLQEVKEKLSQADVDKIFIDCIACLVELRLSWERKGTDEDVDSLDKDFAWDNNISFMSSKWHKTIVEENSLKLSNDHLSVLKDLFSPAFPIKVINFYLGLPDYQALINHKETITSSENTKQNLQIEVKKANTAIKDITRLENKLNKLKEDYNFIGLSHGFENLLNAKKSSSNWNLCLLFALGFIIAAIPVAKILDAYIINPNNIPSHFSNLNWTEILAGIALEFVLIYFFRVALNQYQITKTQIMQLELRRSLCQFIHSYAEYAQKIKAQDANALEKFENIIFSSILSHDANIPGTFDGMEHITSLIKELKGNK